MRFGKVLILLCCGSGCTMMSLERHTAAQTASTGDLRYREVVDNLARCASNPSLLPCYASIYSGSAQVSDTQGLMATTTWQHVIPVTATSKNGFASQVGTPSEQRQIQLNWTLDPIVHTAKLEAMRACAKWVVWGPSRLTSEELSLLMSPDAAPPGPERHFDVAEHLGKLPRGWVRRGCLTQVPALTCYKAHYGQTWVWVEPDGMKGLADFTLILQTIARVGINSPPLFNFGPDYTPLKFAAADSPIDAGNGHWVQMYAQAFVDPNGRLLPDTHFFAAQQEDAGSLSKLKSLINLAVPVPK
jgi:hypothetical protein